MSYSNWPNAGQKITAFDIRNRKKKYVNSPRWLQHRKVSTYAFAELIRNAKPIGSLGSFWINGNT